MASAATTVEEFEQQRRRLFSIAYRMLGSASEAEDVVQDGFVRYQRARPEHLRAPASYLTTVVVNLCLDRLKSARVQREEYVGPWLPEPVLTTGGALGPLETAEQRDAVSLAFLLLLERLNAKERAVSVLREAFGYEHREIAEILGVSEVGSRRLLSRARQRVAEPSSRFQATPSHGRRLVERFLAAAQEGDLRGLEEILAEDVTVWSDGGGKVSAARRPVVGQARVARFVAGIADQARREPELLLTFEEVNGQPALLSWTGESLTAVFAFDLADGRVHAIRAVLNPAKLAFVERQARRGGSHPGAVTG
jgi:RNA polymerase sigma-70 factor (TIGR02957 family)